MAPIWSICALHADVAVSVLLTFAVSRCEGVDRHGPRPASYRSSVSDPLGGPVAS
jgi:hypothetical protein